MSGHSHPKEYLGDGVYAVYDGHNVRLGVRGRDIETLIYLDPVVLDRLNQFVGKQEAKLAEAAAPKGKCATCEGDEEVCADCGRPECGDGEAFCECELAAPLVPCPNCKE